MYLSGRVVLDCGDATASAIDDEVMKILKESYEEAKRLLSENRDVMDQIAAFLIEKETITGKEFMKIFHKAKGIEESEEPERSEKTENKKIEESVKTEEATTENIKTEEQNVEDKKTDDSQDPLFDIGKVKE